VSACPDTTNVRLAGVYDGMEVLARSTSKTSPKSGMSTSERQLRHAAVHARLDALAIGLHYELALTVPLIVGAFSLRGAKMTTHNWIGSFWLRCKLVSVCSVELFYVAHTKLW